MKRMGYADEAYLERKQHVFDHYTSVMCGAFGPHMTVYGTDTKRTRHVDQTYVKQLRNEH
eukprot:2613285-Pyramimonas_sp.AAC.1